MAGELGIAMTANIEGPEDSMENPGDNSVSIAAEIISEESDFFSLAPVWNALLQDSGVDVIFLTWEWLSTWWRHFGADKKLFVIIVRQGNRVVGLAPLVLTKQEGFRSLEFLGQRTTDYKDFIIAKDCDRAAILESILNVLRTHNGWDVMRFNGLVEDSPNCAPLRTILGGARALRPVWNENYDICPYVSTDRSWDSYWASLGHIRRESRRQTTALNRDKAPVIFNEPMNTKEVDSYFDALTRQHIARRKNVKCDFSPFENPAVRAFYKDLANKLFHKGWLRLSFLVANGEAAAIHFGFEYGGKHYGYMQCFNNDFAKYGVGKLLILHLLKQMCAGDVKEYDLLRGGETYKFQFHPQTRRIFSIAFFSEGGRGELAKIWFTRLRPQLDTFAQHPGYLQRVKFRLQRAGQLI